MYRYTLLFIVSFLLTCIAGCASTENGDSSSNVKIQLGDEYYTDLYNYDNTDTLLGRGVNMGNYLEAEGGEGSWSNKRLIQKEDFAVIKSAGFKSVRIPMRWADNTGAEPSYTIDAAFLKRAKEVAGWALEADLRVVINVHHYTKMMSDEASALTTHRSRLKSIWTQLCDEFTLAEYPADKVVFELLNEPNGTVTYAIWNTIINELVTVIRSDKGQDSRYLMIGTANWGGPNGLSNLTLPASCTKENTLITIHWYEPFHFTHQGADWTEGASAWIGTTWVGNESEKNKLFELLDFVTEWNSKNGRGFEIFMGEFGVYTKYANEDCQKAWTAFIAREAEKRKMSWAYWEFDQGFGAYDQTTGTWKTKLYDALIPTEDRP